MTQDRSSSSTASRSRPSAGETIWQVAKRQGIEIPHLCYSPAPGYRPDGNCRACMVEIEGERVLAASCMRTPTVGHEGEDRERRAPRRRAEMVFELLVADQPARETAHDPDSKFWHWADTMGVTESRFPAAERRRRDRSHPAMARQSRRLHPVQPVRARLPRGAGQRRDRHGLSRPRREDRVRLRRSDGRVHLRRLRRVRAGLPDRRADAGGDARRQADARRLCRPQGRLALPLLRRRLPAHLSRQGRQDPLRRGPRRPGQPQPPVRQGPLRLRLRPSPASPDQAADPASRACRRTPTTRSIPPIPARISARRRWEEALDLAAKGLRQDPRRARAARRWPASARPRARTRRPICSRSWCAPASAPTTSTTARGCATPRRWRR